MHERNLAFRFAVDTGKKLLTNVSEILLRDGTARWCRNSLKECRQNYKKTAAPDGKQRVSTICLLSVQRFFSP